MANVNYETNQIKTAIYGEDVRDAIINALKKVGAEGTNLSQLVDTVESELSERITRNATSVALKGDNLYFDEEEKLLYLMSDGQVIGDGIAVSTGGGGGGGGGGSSMYFFKPTLTNQLPDRYIATAAGTDVVLKFAYSSVDETGADDGAGVGRIVIGGVTRKTFTAIQGSNEVHIGDILSPGSNSVSVKVENSEGTIRSLNYTVNIVILELSTTNEKIDGYQGAATVYYTVTGSGEKTVHFVLDGNEIGTEVVSTSGRSRSYVIDTQSHGAHILEIYAESEADGISLESEHLKICMYWIGTSSDPIVATLFDEESIVEGTTISIPYAVYDPSVEPATVTLSVIDGEGEIYSTGTITKDRSTGDPWIISDYPAGNTIFRIACGTTVKDIPVTVEPYTFPISKVTDSLLLEFTAEGRANTESDPATWEYGDIQATFSGFGWNAADGWLYDTDNAAILRFLPGDSMILNFKPFENDMRSTGYTIEVDMATRDVRDATSVVVDCLNADRGLHVTTQKASLVSEQTDVSMQFNEDSRVRISFVVEQTTENRMVYIYINGIMCGAKQYPTNDNFAQRVAQDISIGSEYCGLDLYKIRCYRKSLNRNEIVDNFIVDKPTLIERQNAYEKNNVLNAQELIYIEGLPSDLPYMVFSGDELPQFKGDKKTMTITFKDPLHSDKNFVAEGAEVNVQGTTSQKYPVKNYKFKCKRGFTNNSESFSKYELRTGDIPVNEFCIKVDYASSEGANNVELVQLYEDICKEQGFLTLPQEDDPRVRQGVAGRPILLFWHDTLHNETTFISKANFNNDKGTRETFGFDKYPLSQSWEFKNNTTDICLFKTGDFTNWENDLEAREPDGGTDVSLVQPVFEWVAAHDRSTVDTQDEKDAMLADFKAHFADHFVVDNMLFFYLFTEFFLMIDNRAKNMFITTYDGTHWLMLPYDFDTAIGINNDGELVFPYYLEDYDTWNGGKVFNGQGSVLWDNVRDAYGEELAAMYRTIRSGNVFRYEVVKKRFTDHQAIWPERVWNEDSYIKYIVPYLSSSDETMTEEQKKERADRLAMLQGDKSSQRDWWIFNAFKYRDSKYGATEAKSLVIIMRGYTDESHPISNQSITLKPYSNLFAQVEYASTYNIEKRMEANETHTFVNPMQQMNNTEVYVYSADRISDIGDLSPMNLGQADFSAATKLNRLIIGSSAQGYENTHLTYLSVGANQLLTELNVCNCTALEAAIDLSACVSIEKVLATGSIIKGVQLPVGGHLKQLELPGTVTNLTVRNQKNLETFVMEGYSNISTLRVEYTPNIPIEAIINGADTEKLSRVRLMGINWIASNETELKKMIDRLDGCGGLDINDQNVPKAVVNGFVNIATISTELLVRIQNDYPDLVVVVNGQPQFVVHFLNYDGTVLYNQVVAEGGNATDPVAGGQISTPTRPDEGDTSYAYSGWSTLPTNIHGNENVTAQYVNAYKVKYVNDDGTVLQTKNVTHGQSTQYTGTTPTKAQTDQYTYTFKEWSGADDRATGAINSVTSPRTVTATYTSVIRTYSATFYAEDRSTVLQSSQVAYGSSASYTGTTPTSSDGSEFDGWEPSNMVITADTNFYPKFKSSIEDVEIADDWDAIIGKLESGAYKTVYKIGNYKPLDLGTEGTIDMQIVAMDDEKGAITFIAKELLATKSRMRGASANDGGYPATTEMKPWLDNTIYPMIPEVVRKYIKPVPLTSMTPDGEITHTEKLWIPSYREVKDTLLEQSGPTYYDVFKDNESRQRAISGTSTNSDWWLRSTGSGKYFRFVTSYGSLGSDMASIRYGVCLCFTLDAETITDSWDDINTAITNGTYKTKYSVGDTKRVDLGDQGNILMQIAAFDADDLADGSGNKAAITWVAKQLLVTTPGMNTTNDTTGGYPACELKTYLSDNVWAKVPNAVQSMIKEVTKTSYDYNTTTVVTSAEKLWIPSQREVFGGTDYETSGPVYNDVFKDETSRKRKSYGSTSASFSGWWLRSAHSASSFRICAWLGTGNYEPAKTKKGICLCFCTGTAVPDEWEELAAAIEDGTYATKYSIGDTIDLDLGDEGVIPMEIAAFDTDNLADESGKAHVTFIAKNLLNNYHVMNSTDTTTGGWGSCEMRTYLSETILPKFPSNLQAIIKEVSKTNTGTNYVTDKLWIPSKDEVSTGTSYSSTFNSQTDRMRARLNSSGEMWWTRTRETSPYTFDLIWFDGSIVTTKKPNVSYGILVCFCV